MRRMRSALAALILSVLAGASPAAEFDVALVSAYEDPDGGLVAGPGVFLDAGVAGTLAATESITLWGRAHASGGYGSNGDYEDPLGASGSFFSAEAASDVSYRWGLSSLRIGAKGEAAWRVDALAWEAAPRISLVLGAESWSFFSDHEAAFDSEAGGFDAYSAKAGAVFAIRNAYLKPALVGEVDGGGDVRAGAEVLLSLAAFASLTADFSLKADYGFMTGGIGAEASAKLAGTIIRSLDWETGASAWYDGFAGAAYVYPTCGATWRWDRNWSLGIACKAAIALLPGADGATAPPRWTVAARVSCLLPF